MPSEYLNETVVVDTDTRQTFVGRLTQIGEWSLLLEEVAIYDDSIMPVTLEEYLIECVSIGYVASRKSIWIRSAKVISISLLSDIIIP